MLHVTFLQTHSFNQEVNRSILPQLFEVGGKQKIWHNDALRGRKFKLTGSDAIIDVRTVSGGGHICFSIHIYMCLLEEIKYVKFFNLQVQVSCVTPLGRPQGDEKNDRPQGDEKNDRPQGDKKNETFPGSKGFIQQEELDIPILLDCMGAMQSLMSELFRGGAYLFFYSYIHVFA